MGCGVWGVGVRCGVWVWGVGCGVWGVGEGVSACVLCAQCRLSEIHINIKCTKTAIRF